MCSSDLARAFALAEQSFKSGAFLVGGKFSLADVVMGVAAQYVDIRYPHDWRNGHPKLARWHAGIAARPSFRQTQPPGFTPVV